MHKIFLSEMDLSDMYVEFIINRFGFQIRFAVGSNLLALCRFLFLSKPNVPIIQSHFEKGMNKSIQISSSFSSLLFFQVNCILSENWCCFYHQTQKSHKKTSFLVCHSCNIHRKLTIYLLNIKYLFSMFSVVFISENLCALNLI